MNITKEDFDFIDKFCEKYQIPEGFGHKRFFGLFLVEYKEQFKGEK